MVFWDRKSLDLLYPSGSTTVSSIINEGVYGEQVMKYSDNVNNLEKVVKCHEEFVGLFLTVDLNLKQANMKQYLIKKLLTILGDKYLVSVENNWFGLCCRMINEYSLEVSIENYIGPDLSDFMVKGLIEDLKRNVMFLVNKKIEKLYFYFENLEKSLVFKQRCCIFL